MQKVFSLISIIELIYLMLLPFMGYIGTGILNKGYFALPLLGIAVLLIYQILGYAFWQKKKEKSSLLSKIFLPVSIGLTLTNYIWLEENFWLFWTEKTLFEVGALCISFILISIFGRNNSNRTMSQDLGMGIPIMLGMLLIASFYEIGKAWVNNFPYFGSENLLHLAAMIFSFFLDVLWIYPLLSKFTKRSSKPADITNSKAGMIFLMSELGIWVIVIPAILGIMGYLH
jgi:hypothetical protein